MTVLALTSSTASNTASITAPILRVLRVALAASFEHANTRTHSAREPCQLGFLRLAQLKNRGNSKSFSPMQTDVDRWRYLMYLSFLKNQTLH